MDAVQEAVKSRLFEIRDLASSAQADASLREALMLELGGMTKHISEQIEAWLALEEEAGDLLDLLTLFYEDANAADAAAPQLSMAAHSHVDEPFANLLEPSEDNPLATTLRRGMAFFDLWLFREASETLAQVVRMEPDNLVAKLFLAASETARGNSRAARPLISELIDRTSDDMLRAAAHEIGAQGCFDEQALDEAVGHLQAVVSMLPDYPDTWYNLGICYAKKNDPIGAVGAFSQALALCPDDVDACLALVDVEMQLAEYQVAQETLMTGLQHHPLQVGLILRMARLWSTCGRLSESLQWYLMAIQANPEVHAAWSGYAGILLRMGRRDEAIAALKKYMSIQPNHTDTLTQLAVLQSLRGDAVNERYLQLLEVRGHPALTDLAKGRVELQQGHVKRALVSFQKALQGRTTPAIHRLATQYREEVQARLTQSE